LAFDIGQNLSSLTGEVVLGDLDIKVVVHI